MVKVIAVANQKGGCGKTTTSINLSAALAFFGKRVLVIDLDPQAHSSIGLGINPEELEKSLYDVFNDAHSHALGIEDIIVRIHKNLDLAPAQVLLSAVEQTLSGVQGREHRLAEKIKTLKNAYDYIIIDCPPNLGLLTFNALTAADEVLIPVEPSFFSLHGLKKLLETVTLVKEVVSHSITAHAVITRYDGRTKYAREQCAAIQKYFGENTMTVIIRKNVTLQEAAEKGKPITEFDRESVGFKDFMNLAVEVIERCGRDGIPPDLTYVKEETSEEGIHDDNFAVTDEFLNLLSSNIPSLSEQAVPLLRNEYQATIVKEPESAVEQKKVLHYVDCEPDYSPRMTSNGMLFSFRAKDAQKVQIAGCFTHWEIRNLNTPGFGEDVWTTVIPLTSGTYRYKYIVDGQWVCDPSNNNRVMNAFNGEDCLIVVE